MIKVIRTIYRAFQWLFLKKNKDKDTCYRCENRMKKGKTRSGLSHDSYRTFAYRFYCFKCYLKREIYRG